MVNRSFAALWVLVAGLLAGPASAFELFEGKLYIGGYLETTNLIRSADFSDEWDLVSNRNVLNVEAEWDAAEDLWIFDKISFFARGLGVYEGIYDLNPRLFGDRVESAPWGHKVPQGITGYVMPITADPARNRRQIFAAFRDVIPPPFNQYQIVFIPVANGVALAPFRPKDVPVKFSGEADIDFSENELKFERTASQDEGELRELYIDLEMGPLFIRFGRQIIVWGKTEIFRNQDVINPIDISFHGVFAGLEESRIPQWATRAIYSFGEVGPLQDVRFELVWNFDDFEPTDIGQCGEPWASLPACQKRMGFLTNQLLGIGIIAEERPPSRIDRKEFGFRIDWRWRRFSFSISDYYGYRDTPTAVTVNSYALDNPNWKLLNVVSDVCEIELEDQPGFFRDAICLGTILGIGVPPGAATLANTSADSQTTRDFFNALALIGEDAAVESFGDLIGSRRDGTPVWFWHAGTQLKLVYPRLNIIGASVDFPIDWMKGIMAAELSYTNSELVFDNTEPTGVRESDVLRWVVSFDRPTFIKFLNPHRAFIINTQHFFEYWLDHHGDGRTGQLAPRFNAFSTFTILGFYMQDRLLLRWTQFYDYDAAALFSQISASYRVRDNVIVSVGANIIAGRQKVHRVQEAFEPIVPSDVSKSTEFVGATKEAIGLFRDNDEIWFSLRLTF